MQSDGLWFAHGTALVLAVFICGCNKTESEPAFLKGTNAPMRWPIAWMPNSGTLVAIHLERRIDDHGSVVLCDRSGWFQSELGGDSVVKLQGRLPERVCALDLRPETVSGSSSGTELLLSDGSAIVSLDLQTANVALVKVAGIQVMSYVARSPDGRRIAFVGRLTEDTLGADGGDYVYVANADGSGVRELARFDRRRVRSAPSWSPNQKHIALSTSVLMGGPYLSDGEVVIVDSNSGETRRLVRGYFPSWSPDGFWIAYLSLPILDPTLVPSDTATDSVYTALRVVRPDGAQDLEVFAERGPNPRTIRRLTNGWPWPPIVWSLDSKSMAFTRVQDGGTNVWVIQTTGRGLERRGF